MKITILGSTSTIGINTLSVLSKLEIKHKVFALTAKSNYKLLFKQIKKYNPVYAVLICPKSAEKISYLCKKNSIKTKILCGTSELSYVCMHKECTCVMSAIVGAAALEPTLNAIKKGKRIFLANKESLVMSGNLFIKSAKKYNSLILPVDSEHNAIFQILFASGLSYKPGDGSYYKKNLDEIILTASGGPFVDLPISKFKAISPNRAIKHPNWKMGKKISVDSSTMMNKGLEVIEASILFGLSYEKIKVLIHKQSIVHAIIVFKDGSMLSHMSDHDMRIPISFSLSYPSRFDLNLKKLDLVKEKNLTFSPVDKRKFKCLNLAYEAIKIGLNAPTILNAANEVAVNNFLKNKIKFSDIPVIIEKALKEVSFRENTSLNGIIEDDKYTREFAEELIKRIK